MTAASPAPAVGLTGSSGYLSTVLSGVDVGSLVESRGWDAGLLMFTVSALVGGLLSALCRPAPADGYGGNRTRSSDAA